MNNETMAPAVTDVDMEVERLTAAFLKQLRHSQGSREIYERAEVHVTFNSFLWITKPPRSIAERIRDRVLETITLSEPMPA